jgi:type II secretory pathway component GspD/PulD (secretin)
MGMSWRLSIDARTRSLIVKVTEQDLQIAADLVAVLDLGKDKAIPKVKSLRALKLKHAMAKEISSVLEGLDLEAKIVPVEKSNLLIVTGTEEIMKEIEGVVDALDVEVKDEPKKKDGAE